MDLLASVIAGTVTRPGDPGWDEARAAWNLTVDQVPVAVVDLADASDAVAVMAQAVAGDLTLTVQPRGHGAVPGTTDGAILVRTTALQDITIDADRRVARVGAGVRWGDLNARLDGTGLIALSGANPSVSVVGYLLGGGLSWFGRRYGVASTSVRAVEVVTPTEGLVRVSAEHDPELFWALRGGGGDFGIVTAMEIGLFPEPSIVGGQLAFGMSAAPEVLAAYAELTATAPPELTAFANLMHFPPLPFLPEPLRGQSLAVLAVAYLGSPDELDRLLAPVRALGPTIQDTVSPRPPGRFGEFAEEPTDPSPSLDHGFLLRGFDGGTAARLLEAGADRQVTPLLAIGVRHLGAGFATGGPDGGVAACIPEPYLVGAIGMVLDPGTATGIRDGFRALQAGLGADAVDRAPYNFLGDRPISAAYGPEDLARLRDLKRTRDPRNLLRSNRPVLA